MDRGLDGLQFSVKDEPDVQLHLFTTKYDCKILLILPDIGNLQSQLLYLSDSVTILLITISPQWWRCVCRRSSFCVSPIRGNTGNMYKDMTLLWAAK